MTKTIKAFQLVAAVSAMIGALAVVALRAQMSSPLITIAARLAAGPDFATDVLGDSWDMCNADDISVYVDEQLGWANFAWSPATATRPCLVGGTTTTNDTNLSLLFRGFEDIINPDRSGLRSPIDPNVYKKVAFKMYSGATPNWQIPQVYWFHRPYTFEDPFSAYGVRQIGATGNGVNGNVNTNKIYVDDLSRVAPAQSAGTTWTDTTFGPVRGFRIDPNSSESGHQVFFYWARLTRGDTDPLAVSTIVSWSGGTSGSTSIDVLDAFSGSDNAILNVGSNLAASGTISKWYYGILPPGKYTLRITSGNGQQSQPFTINTPPSLTILDPDATGGEDFATKVLGDPWDMNNAADIPVAAHLSAASFHDGLFDGTSDGVDYGANGGDPLLFLLTNTNNLTPIDSQRYRFLTFRMQLEAPFSLLLGSIARVFWGPTQNSATNLTTTKDIIMWPGMRSYTIDLGSLTATRFGGIEPGGASTQVWTAAPIRQFRIDPSEFIAKNRFLLEDVKLAAMDEAAGGSFVIRFAGSDPDDAAPLVTLYYDTNNNAADGRTLIASGLPLGAGGAGQYNWNTSSIPKGVYYISADISDGLNTQTTYSTGQLLVGNAAPPPPASGSEAAMDFGAAGLWAIYNNGAFSQLHSTNPGAMATGDLDGDGKDDLIVSFPGAGVWVWSNNSSWYQLHTSNAALIATGDLDGNGKSEVLLDFPGLGVWVRLNNSSWFRLHPASPSRMVTADLDGNGQDEVILDFPGAGVWVWNNNASWSQLHTANAAAIVAGDFDASGRADLLLAFPGAGLWVMSNNTSWFQLHPGGATVMTTGDLDGNGRAEAIISFPGAGIWAWMNGAGFVQLHTSTGTLMSAADLDGSGRADVIVSFPGGGVWAWMNNANWRQLHASNPEGIAVGNLDGN